MKDNVINIEENPKFKNIYLKKEYDIIKDEYEALHEVQRSRLETASASQGGDGKMENVYEKLIDRLDQDIRDHKQEIRDRDAKWQAEILKREEFYRSESKEREQRIIKAFDDLKNDFKDVKNDVRESSKHIRNLSITSIVAMITTIAAIAGIAITVYFSTFPQ